MNGVNENENDMSTFQSESYTNLNIDVVTILSPRTI